jgi:hypothetical protein
MTRHTVRALAAGALVALALGATFASTAGATGTSKVKPVLECIVKQSDGSYRAYWGYTNSSSSNVTIPVGSSNTFTPAPADRGQPTVFTPGTKHSVFSTVFPASGSVTWKVQGTSVTATKRSKCCGDTPVPVMAAGIPLLVAFGLLGGVGYLVLRRRKAGPDA